MSTENAQLELMRRCLDDEASDEELVQLEELLRNDSEFRKNYLSYVNVDVALAALPKERQQADTPSNTTVTFPQWRPLATSAAAGLVFGLFCATVAWAIVVPRKPATTARVVVPILTESFESSTTPIIRGFPSQAGDWGGDRAQIVSSPPSDQPFDGDLVLKLEASPRFKIAFLHQIVDVSSFPNAGEGEMRVVEVISSFLADQPGERERYTLHIASFKESPEEIRSLREGVTTPEMDELTLTISRSGLSTLANAQGWQTLSAMVEVPADAHSVVISLGAGRRFRKSPKTPHYVDDIRAELRIIPFSERLGAKNR